MKLTVKRLLAYWLDVTLVATVLLGAQLSLYFISSGFPFDYLDQGYEIELWVLATISFPVWLYFIWSELTYQKTIGKKLLGLKVLSDVGINLTFRQALVRTFIKLLPWEMTQLIILVPEPWWSVDEPRNVFLIYLPNAMMTIYIAVVLSGRGVKGFHDYPARTRVVSIE
jgi:uncharacterized RDD family membrane protein YckC